jgi:hypothetical protein
MNSFEIMGRLGSRVVQKELPSGDIATTFAVIVDRPIGEYVGTTKVDTMPCQTFRASVAKKVLTLEPGTAVNCTGVLGVDFGSHREVWAVLLRSRFVLSSVQRRRGRLLG